MARSWIRSPALPNGRRDRGPRLPLTPGPWLAAALSGLVLQGCPLSDNYAVTQDAGTREADTAGSSSSATGGKGTSLRDAGDTLTGGSPSSGGQAEATGGKPSETGGAETGGNDETGGSLETGGKSETGGEPSTGGSPSETGGESAQAGGTGGEPDAPNAGAAGESVPDECPDDPAKTAPGLCGCSMAETDCLAHRYRFNGTDTDVAMDWIDDAGGDIVNTTASDGSVTLSGRAMSAEYVRFPANILSTLTDATLELWVTWTTQGASQKLLDFGDSTTYMGNTTRNTYLYICPQAGGTGSLRAAFSVGAASGAVLAEAPQALPLDEMAYIAVVIDDSASRMTLYLNGESQDTVSLSGSLSELNDVNNWLGRSLTSADPYFAGSIHEFRIYQVARTDAQIAESYEVGPDELPGS
jgi:hypothetical protein